jgi:hypothetical protein
MHVNTAYGPMAARFHPLRAFSLARIAFEGAESRAFDGAIRSGRAAERMSKILGGYNEATDAA